MTDSEGFTDPHLDPPATPWTAPPPPPQQPAQPAQPASEPATEPQPWSAPTQPQADWSAPTQPQSDWSTPPAPTAPAAYPPPSAYPAQPTYPPPQGQPTWGQPPAAWGPPPPAPPARRRRRGLVLIVVACLVAAGIGVGAVMVLSSSSQKFTYQGATIDKPGDVLSTAEKGVKSIVTSRHGVMAGDTRCYFAKQANAAAGASKDDVDSAVRCGPVLFVDGDPAKTYLAFTLSTTSKTGNKVDLRTADNPDPEDPQPLPATLKLARPDGKTAPKSSGLAVPAPPPADKKALLATDLGKLSPPKQLDNAEMISLNTGVRVISAGVVARYGSGDAARVAPPGEQLIAFQLEDEPGEAASDPSTGSLRLIDSSGSRSVPEGNNSDDYIVVAEPPNAAVNLSLKDGGYTQTIALPTGKPGANNLTVLTRDNRFDNVSKKLDVPVTFDADGQSASTTFHATVDGARLEFWMPRRTQLHPAHPGDAYLFVNITYTDPLDDTGQTFGFDPQLLSVRLPNGQIVHARNVSTESDKLLDVLEVPGNFTKGTLVISGSVSRDGLTITVNSPVTMPLSFQAG